MNKKYELLPKGENGLHQVKSLRDLGDVKVGELGGYIEKESNLSHEGNAWVSGNARVYGDARVYGNAWVFDNAWVSGNARVFGNAWVYGNAWVFDNARVSGNARVFGNAWVSGDARVFGNAQVTKCLYFQQFKHSITVTDTHVFIGCEGHSWAYWKANITQIGEEHEYTPDEIRQVANLLNILHLQINGKLLTETPK